MGMVYLIGAGPGDPELITVKGMELLKKCDAVIYDRLGTYQLLEYVPEHCEKIYVGKQAGAHSKKQSEINEILIQTAKKYEMVVRLKGGDPFVFGRGGEEAEVLLAENIPFRLVPGITSAIAVPEVLGIPVTHRGVARSFQVITGHTMEEGLPHFGNIEGTGVFLMGLSHLEKIVERLSEQGMESSTPVAVIANGTLPEEQILRGTLADIVDLVRKSKMASPAVIVVGKTAAYAFCSPNTGHLAGKQIGIVGTAPLYRKLKDKFKQYGAKVCCLCDMKVKPTKQFEDLREKVLHLEEYTWIGFTSQNAVKLFFDCLREAKTDFRRLSHIRFAVVGSGTGAALEQYGFHADLMPKEYTTKGLAKELSLAVKKGEKLLLPRAKQGSLEMLTILEKHGISCDALPIYDVVGRHTLNMEYLEKLSCILFLSASGVESFMQYDKGSTFLVDRIQEASIRLGCIGEVTEQALKKYELHAEILPQVNDVEGLVEAVLEQL